MTTFQIILTVLLILCALYGLWSLAYSWAKTRTLKAVRQDLYELDRREDEYRYGFLSRLGRRMKSTKTRWLNRGKAQHQADIR